MMPIQEHTKDQHNGYCDMNIHMPDFKSGRADDPLISMD